LAIEKWRDNMLRNYLLITLRNIRRFKVFSFISIAGLSVSLAIVILIASYAEMELSVNKFHKNYNNIYKIGSSMTPAPIADIIKLNIPQIRKIARVETFRTTSVTMKYKNNSMIVKNLIFSDPDFFDIFTFAPIKGELETALNDPNNLVLTETEAKRFFGNEDPIDKSIKLDNEYDLIVKAIIKDVPEKSSMQFSGVVSFSSIKAMNSSGNNDPYNWWNRNYETYLLAPDRYNQEILQETIEPVLRNNIPKEVKDLNVDLFPFKDIYYHPELSSFHSHGSKEKSFILISIAILILVIAAINYINLSTARASMRTKEMGIRKTVGASKLMLVKQFLSESIVTSTISMFFAVLIASELTHVVTDLVDLHLAVFPDFVLIRNIIFAAAAVVIGVLAGTYPAFYLASYKPGSILRGEIHKSRGKAYLRRISIVFQFSIAVILISATLIIYKQTEYLRNKPLGFQKENIIYFSLNRQIEAAQEAFKNRITQQSAVKDFAYSSGVPGEAGMVWGQSLNYEGKDSQIFFYAVPISSGFVSLMEMELVKGRDFIPNDQADIANVIVNEAFVRKNGLKEPVKARLTNMGPGKGNIVGIVKDFNFQSLHSEVQPLVFFNFPGYSRFGLIKINSANYSDIKEVIEYLKKTWKDFSPDFPLEYNFLDEKLDMQYKAEEKFENAFIGFSLLAIIISCLGLFGLSSFATEQRTKEIGIRKILGASIPGITIMLSKQFVVLVIISNIIAWPAAYYIAASWLQDFAYRIDISWWMFVLSGAIALVIALATVSFQAIKAATANPVDSLRYE
jgi:putative ABC transport system permease protein